MKAKGCKKKFYANSKQKRSGMATLIQNRVEVKFYNKEEHYILKKGPSRRYDNYKQYASSKKVPKHINCKQNLREK